MKPHVKIFIFLTVAGFIAYTSCKKNTKENPPVTTQSGAAILSFRPDTGQATAAVINNTDSANITLSVYPYVNLFHRIAYLTVPKGATVSPASGTVINFTANTPYYYTVTSASGEVKRWKVVIKIQGDNGVLATAAYKDTTVTNFFRRTSGHIA